MKNKTRNFLVTPEGFDNIGAVLDGLGSAFAHSEISWEDLRDPRSLKGCEVLFINCDSVSSGTEPDVALTVRKFVENGGSLYASDWAGAVIKDGNHTSTDQAISWPGNKEAI